MFHKVEMMKIHVWYTLLFFPYGAFSFYNFLAQPLITQQPGHSVPPGMTMGQFAGLQNLTTVDQLLIKQKVEFIEAVTGIETENNYEVVNSMGQLVSDSTLDFSSHWF